MIVKTASTTLRCAALAALLLAAPAFADELADVTKLLRAGKATEALARTNEFLSKHPADPQMRFMKGVLLAEQSRTDEAIVVFTKLTEDYKDLPEPYNNLAVLYAANGQYEKARIALEKAIRTNPSYMTAYENLGDVYGKLASQAYDKALALGNSAPPAKSKLTLLRTFSSNTGSKVSVAVPEPQVASAAPAAAAPAAASQPQVKLVSQIPEQPKNPPLQRIPSMAVTPAAPAAAPARPVAAAPVPVPAPVAVAKPAPTAPAPAPAPQLAAAKPAAVAPAPVAAAPAAIVAKALPAPVPAAPLAAAAKPAAAAPASAPAQTVVKTLPSPVPAAPAVAPVQVAAAAKPAPAAAPVAAAKPAPATPAPAAAAPLVAAAAPAKAAPAKPEPAKPAASENADRDDVLNRVHGWAKAWSSQDVDSYLGYYSNEFAPPKGVSRQAWAQERRARIAGKGRIHVEVNAPQVVVTGDTAKVTFRQVYESDRLSANSRKTLLLVKHGGKWQIKQESSGS